MSGRVKKLRRAIAASTIPQKEVMLGAIDKCLAHASRKPAETSVDPLLAFGARRATRNGAYTAATEAEFRLYARMAICLAGYVSLPALKQEATDLKAALNGKNYADVAYARQQYNKYRGLAAAMQGIASVAIVDIDTFVDKVHMGEGVVAARIDKAAKVGIESIRESIRRLESNSGETPALVARWFGAGAQGELLANFKKLLARCTDPMDPIFIKYEVKNVWGTSSSNSRSINLGNRFFSDDDTLPSSKFGREYIANDEMIAQVREVSSKYTELKRKERSLDLVTNQWTYSAPTQLLAAHVAEVAADGIALGLSELKGKTKEGYAASLLADVEWFGLKGTETIRESKAREVAAKAKFEREKKTLVDGQGDLATMEVTAFGAFVHELTHMVLATQDTDAACIDVPGQMAYGPLLCQMLAAKDKDLALNNADNYRHFVECWVTDAL